MGITIRHKRDCIALKMRLAYVALTAWMLNMSIYANAQNARLFISSGTSLTLTNNTLVLNNTDLRCDGALTAPNGTMLLTGTSNTAFSGSGIPNVQVLTLNTSSASTLTLNNNLQVSGNLNFQNGIIALNGHQIILTGNASLQGESESSHTTGPTGGSVTASASGVVAPALLNIGNLGAAITSGASLGNLTVTRSNQPAVNPVNNSLQGIQRTYLIQPQNNTALNATLRFYYLNEELNGYDPTTLSLWKSTDGINWSLIGADTRNTAAKYVEKTGLTDLSLWTLSNPVNPLPITLLSFGALCKDGYALLQWRTGMESDVDHFEIEKSTDGNSWADIQNVPATNAPGGSSYEYKDPATQPVCLYRLAIIEKSGNITYSPIFQGGCAEIPIPLSVYPNPSPSQATARLSVREAAQGILRIYNINGQLVYQHNWDLVPGINQFVLPAEALPAGSYVVRLLLKTGSQQTILIKD